MESIMSIKTKIAAIAVAALALTGGIAATTQQAQAGYRGVGIGVGVAAGALVGAAIASNVYGGPVYASGYGYGYRRCGYVRQFDVYGNYVGRVRTCNY
jgi:hypothetical protein